MAHKINENCVSCGSCVQECPVEAISQGQDRFVINPEKCTDCGSCVAACPVDAIEAP